MIVIPGSLTEPGFLFISVFLNNVKRFVMDFIPHIKV